MSPDTNEIAPERRFRLQPIVASLFEELSGIATGPESFDASFLELGFDSLFLTQVTQAVQRRFGVKVTFRQIVEQHSSISALAAHLDSLLPADAFQVEKPRQAAAATTASTKSVSAPSPASSSQLEE